MSRYHYGYIMNIEKAVQLTLLRDDRLRQLARQDGLEEWVDVLVSSAIEWVRREVPMPGLAPGSVWFGSGHSTTCWSLPPNMQLQYRSEEDARRLRKFKKLVGLSGEPLLMESATDGRREPARYKTRPPLPLFIDWSLSTFIQRSCDREITVDSILGHLGDLPDIQKLSLTEGEEDSESQGTERTQTNLRSVQGL